MIGGGAEIVHHLDPIFRALAPGVDAASRTLQGVSAVDSRACFDASMAQDEAIGFVGSSPTSPTNSLPA